MIEIVFKSSELVKVYKSKTYFYRLVLWVLLAVVVYVLHTYLWDRSGKSHFAQYTIFLLSPFFISLIIPYSEKVDVHGKSVFRSVQFCVAVYGLLYIAITSAVYLVFGMVSIAVVFVTGGILSLSAVDISSSQIESIISVTLFIPTWLVFLPVDEPVLANVIRFFCVVPTLLLRNAFFLNREYRDRENWSEMDKADVTKQLENDIGAEVEKMRGKSVFWGLKSNRPETYTKS